MYLKKITIYNAQYVIGSSNIYGIKIRLIFNHIVENWCENRNWNAYCKLRHQVGFSIFGKMISALIHYVKYFVLPFVDI